MKLQLRLCEVQESYEGKNLASAYLLGRPRRPRPRFEILNAVLDHAIIQVAAQPRVEGNALRNKPPRSPPGHDLLACPKLALLKVIKPTSDMVTLNP